MQSTLARLVDFRKRVLCQVVSIDGQPAPAAIVGTFPMPLGTRFEWHEHAKHQIAWSPEGVLVVVIEGGGSYVLPPSRALWIPAGTVHETRASGAAVLRSVYLEPRRCPIDWAVPTPVAVSSLLGELIHHLDDRALGAEERARAEAVLFDLLLPLRLATIDVRPPTDPRARDVSDGLLADPADPRTLPEWGHAVGASSRTLARAFLSDTGLTFGRWRTLVRLQASLPYLAEQTPVSAVARLVGYRTTSAYVAAFRAHTGVTPRRYFQPLASAPLPHRATGGIPVEDLVDPVD
jgi:AraC-like DNA-binding protein/quercetin dioxygenase-like cupin family protein